jgi:hypothetical protein
MSIPDRSMHAVLRVDVRTRKDGEYYTDLSDVLRHAKMWIEAGLSDRNDFTDVMVTEMPPPAPQVTLGDLVKDAFAVRNAGCPSCSDGTHPSAPCKCGHDYHGHSSIGMNVRRPCLNCKCEAYQESQNYPRCGAWGGCPMPLGHNKGHADLPERHRAPDVEMSEPDNPAAHALAEYIASHPASTVMAACRYLGWKLTFDIQEDTCSHGPERHGPEAGCIECRCSSATGHATERTYACLQCRDTGACNGGPCPLSAESSLSVCSVCSGGMEWINGETGGWWSHWDASVDAAHRAVPTPSECPAALLPAGSDPAEPCVVGNPRNPLPHRTHRTAQGEAWIPSDEP